MPLSHAQKRGVRRSTIGITPLSRKGRIMVKVSPKPRRVASVAPICVHCGRPRVVARLSEVVGFQRRHPVEGLSEAIVELQRLFRADQVIEVCPRCLCITVDRRRHQH